MIDWFWVLISAQAAFAVGLWSYEPMKHLIEKLVDREFEKYEKKHKNNEDR